MSEKLDPELQAIATLISTLEPLSPDARNNVIDFVFRRLGITSRSTTPVSPQSEFHDPEPASTTRLGRQEVPENAADLRSVKNDKNPKTANQMVALVAYYLANLAPASERRDYIAAEDIKKYFVQAGFPLPSAPPRMTLVNAKNAGYLDALKDGQYRLNPVGHNLIAHRLPADSNGPARTPRRARKTRGTSKSKRR